MTKPMKSKTPKPYPSAPCPRCGKPSTWVAFHDRKGLHYYPRAAGDVVATIGCGRHAGGAGYCVRLDALLDLTPYGAEDAWHGDVANRHEDWIRQVGEKEWRGDLALRRNPLWLRLWRENANGAEFRIWSHRTWGFASSGVTP